MQSNHCSNDGMQNASAESHAAASPSAVEHLTAQEVKDVIAEWNKEIGAREEASTQPSIAAVAATLDISEAEACRLLRVVRQKRQAGNLARRKRLTWRAFAAVGIMSICGYLFNDTLEATNQRDGTFVVDNVQVRPAAADDNVLAYPLDKQVTRMDVRLTYNPPSLWHFLVGPSWRPAQSALYLMTRAGQRLDTFPLPGGSSAGITQGWLRHTGNHQYTEGFAFPASALRGGGTVLWFSQAADDHPEQTFAVPVVDQSTNASN